MTPSCTVIVVLDLCVIVGLDPTIYMSFPGLTGESILDCVVKIPVSSTGMTENVSTGMTENAIMGMTENMNAVITYI